MYFNPELPFIIIGIGPKHMPGIKNVSSIQETERKRKDNDSSHHLMPNMRTSFDRQIATREQDRFFEQDVFSTISVASFKKFKAIYFC